MTRLSQTLFAAVAAIAMAAISIGAVTSVPANPTIAMTSVATLA